MVRPTRDLVPGWNCSWTAGQWPPGWGQAAVARALTAVACPLERPCPDPHRPPRRLAGALSHQPEDVRDENLLTACRRCPLRIDHGHHRITRSLPLAARATAAEQLGLLPQTALVRNEPRTPPRPQRCEGPPPTALPRTPTEDEAMARISGENRPRPIRTAPSPTTQSTPPASREGRCPPPSWLLTAVNSQHSIRAGPGGTNYSADAGRSVDRGQHEGLPRTKRGSP